MYEISTMLHFNTTVDRVVIGVSVTPVSPTEVTSVSKKLWEPVSAKKFCVVFSDVLET